MKTARLSSFHGLGEEGMCTKAGIAFALPSVVRIIQIFVCQKRVRFYAEDLMIYDGTQAWCVRPSCTRPLLEMPPLPKRV